MHDPRYTEVFKETYLRPVDGHRVFAIQPGINISYFTVFLTLYIVLSDGVIVLHHFNALVCSQSIRVHRILEKSLKVLEKSLNLNVPYFEIFANR